MMPTRERIQQQLSGSFQKFQLRFFGRCWKIIKKSVSFHPKTRKVSPLQRTSTSQLLEKSNKREGKCRTLALGQISKLEDEISKCMPRYTRIFGPHLVR